MSNWSMRTRIIAAFSVIIAIMVTMGVISYARLHAIRAEASFLEDDALPGVLLSGEISISAKGLYPAVLTRVAAGDAGAKVRAAATVDRILADLAHTEEQYERTIRTDSDRRMFTALRSSQDQFVRSYQKAIQDDIITDPEANAELRQPLERLTQLGDSLVTLNRQHGQAAATAIVNSANVSRWTLMVAVTAATLVSAVFAWLLLSMLDRLIGQVQQSGIQVNSSATEIAATSKQQQATATEIAATTSEVGATASRISATSKELVRTMDEVAAVADQTASLAEGGQGGLQRMGASMQQIGEASTLINSRLALLSEKAANIGLMVTTINKVADQTNLLSLNAAIEAEKAGEHGRGFTVVAREIRRLADQTAGATFDIEQLVKEMQSAVSAGVMGMDKFSEEVRRGGEVIGQVTGQLSEIIDQVQALTPSFDAVNEGVKSQSISAEQISDALSQLSVAAQQTADSLRQSNLAIEQLNDAARGLQSGVAKFSQDG
jgi:methyl-accepting chemotaxis protein WspA